LIRAPFPAPANSLDHAYLLAALLIGVMWQINDDQKHAQSAPAVEQPAADCPSAPYRQRSDDVFNPARRPL
jgi:hypothetical protein